MPITLEHTTKWICYVTLWPRGLLPPSDWVKFRFDLDFVWKARKSRRRLWRFIHGGFGTSFRARWRGSGQEKKKEEKKLSSRKRQIRSSSCFSFRFLPQAHRTWLGFKGRKWFFFFLFKFIKPGGLQPAGKKNRTTTTSCVDPGA